MRDSGTDCYRLLAVSSIVHIDMEGRIAGPRLPKRLEESLVLPIRLCKGVRGANGKPLCRLRISGWLLLFKSALDFITARIQSTERLLCQVQQVASDTQHTVGPLVMEWSIHCVSFPSHCADWRVEVRAEESGQEVAVELQRLLEAQDSNRNFPNWENHGKTMTSLCLQNRLFSGWLWLWCWCWCWC